MSAVAQATNPIIRWEYFVDEWDQVSEALVQHLQLTLISVGLGIVISAVLTALALKFHWASTPISGLTGVLYTIPSVALFGLLVPYTGLSIWTAVIPLIAYTLLILVTNFVAGFQAVPAAVRDAADGMGLTPARRVWGVELPVAAPYIITGIRIAVVSTVGLVTVAAIIGQGGLGRLILDGLRRTFWTPMVIGASLSILLALVLDLAVQLIGRLLTPWTRRTRRMSAIGNSSAALLGQAAVPRDIGVVEWLFDPASWTGSAGIWASLWETVQLSFIVVTIAVVLTVPLAAVLSHLRKGEFVATWAVTLSRAVPTFAIAGLLVPITLRQGWGAEPWPIFVALLLLALPPIYLNTYTAVRQVDPATIDAARAVGLTETTVLMKVELSLGAALIVSGIRVAAVQVVATEPIRAFLGGDGLGRYLRDGLGQNNNSLVIAGGILIATLAAATGLAVGALERLLPRGVRRLRRVAR